MSPTQRYKGSESATDPGHQKGEASLRTYIQVRAAWGFWVFPFRVAASENILECLNHSQQMNI